VNASRPRLNGLAATTTGHTTSPLSRLEHLSNYPRLYERIQIVAHAGYSTVQITACLAQAGFRSPKQAKPFGRQSVVELMRRLAVHHPPDGTAPPAESTRVVVVGPGAGIGGLERDAASVVAVRLA
jgi:hypothetical protein